MIARCKRTARTFEELRGGELAPLDEALSRVLIATLLPLRITIQDE